MPSVAKVMTGRFRRALAAPVDALGGAQRALAVAEDNATQLNQTTTMVGISFIHEGEKVQMMVSNDIAYSAEGAGEAPNVAKKLVASLAPLVSAADLQRRLVSLAADGAVILHNVGEQLRKELDIGDANRCLALWDPAHKLQLAAHDMREDKTGTINLQAVEWYAIMLTELSEMLEGITWGKGLEELKRIAADVLVRLLTAKRFCLGRFVGSEVVVYESFLRNYPVMVKYLEKHSTVPATAKRVARNVLEEKAYAKLQKLTNFSFVFEILMARDICLRLRQTSLVLQDGKGLEWETVEEVHALIAELRAAADAADADDAPKSAGGAGGQGDACFPPDASKAGARLLPALFKLLHGCDDDANPRGGGTSRSVLAQLCSTGVFCGVQLRLPLIDPDEPSKGRHMLASAYGVAVDEAHDALAALVHFLTTRFVNNKGAPRQVKGEKPGHSMVDKEGQWAPRWSRSWQSAWISASSSACPLRHPRPSASASRTAAAARTAATARRRLRRCPPSPALRRPLRTVRHAR
jgi:hypothetical protein